MYKANNTLLPVNLQKLFIKNNKVHKYNTRSVDKFHQCSTRSVLRCKTTSVVGTKLWNSLDVYIRHSSTVNIFKKVYRKFLQNQYAQM